ncbi:MAG: T9SS type A sorting domain-containing protein [Candidatus Zixiibacteriota bacterium]|nr:MAG: T9SS type A sorting domain-containing protein [candidate division Zixibacteria bacterium]
MRSNSPGIEYVLTVIAVFLSLSIPKSSATDVSGDVCGEWAAAGNPYNVVGDLRVPPGSTLVIGPGCYIEFQGYYQFLVDTLSVLRALGTESDSIYFNAADTITGWRGITLDHAYSGSVISYCEFEYVNYNWGESVIKAESSNPIISHNTFANNASFVILCDGSDQIEIYDNLFAFNSIEYGEIIVNSSTQPAFISNNIFKYNSCEFIILSFTEINIIGNRFEYNEAGIFCAWGAPANFKRNIACFNNSIVATSLIIGMDALCHIESNTICNNIAGWTVGYFVEEHNSQPVYMTSNIFWGNVCSWDTLFYHLGISLTISYSDIQGGWYGWGNIDTDPLFVDTANSDFHLMPGSPCIDAGDPASPLDPDSTRADMGALYFDQTTGITPLPLLPREITLYQNYPNPFNAGTIIRFDVEDESRISINVYDLLGRRVSSIVDGYYRPGTHEISWDGLSRSGKELPTGIYLYKLKSDTFEQTRKMILLK